MFVIRYLLYGWIVPSPRLFQMALFYGDLRLVADLPQLTLVPRSFLLHLGASWHLLLPVATAGRGLSARLQPSSLGRDAHR